jgi:hypothetical protein
MVDDGEHETDRGGDADPTAALRTACGPVPVR